MAKHQERYKNTLDISQQTGQNDGGLGSVHVSMFSVALNRHFRYLIMKVCSGLWY